MFNPNLELVDTRTLSQKCADYITEFCGSWTFVIWCSLFIGGWIALNTGLFLIGAFDTYPYIALNLVLTIVSTMQSPLIMMSQNRQMERDRESVELIHEKLDDILYHISDRPDASNKK